MWWVRVAIGLMDDSVHGLWDDLPDVADQLPGVVVCRQTSHVRAACLVDPLAGEVES